MTMYYGEDIKINEDDIDFFKWLGGFFDGEGCFTIAVTKHMHRKTAFSNFMVVPTIQISQIDSSREYILSINDIVSKYIPNYTVSIVVDKHKNDKSGICRNDQIKFAVSGANSCYAFANMLYPFLKVKMDTCKKFLIICKMIKEQRHLYYDGFMEICRLRDRLNSRKKPYNYWSYSKIKEEISFKDYKENRKLKSITFLEKEKVREMFTCGCDIKKIAEEIGRTEVSISHIISRLKLKR